MLFVNFEGVSMSGTNNFVISLGDSGGIETSGYIQDTGVAVNGAGTISGVSSGQGCPIPGVAATSLVTGTIMWILKDSSTNTWAASYSVVVQGYNVYRAAMGGTVKALSGVLTQVEIDNNGSDTFDAGSAGISYL